LTTPAAEEQCPPSDISLPLSLGSHWKGFDLELIGTQAQQDHSKAFAAPQATTFESN
jgi:hypothetical protein